MASCATPVIYVWCLGVLHVYKYRCIKCVADTYVIHMFCMASCAKPVIYVCF